MLWGVKALLSQQVLPCLLCSGRLHPVLLQLTGLRWACFRHCRLLHAGVQRRLGLMSSLSYWGAVLL